MRSKTDSALQSRSSGMDEESVRAMFTAIRGKHADDAYISRLIAEGQYRAEHLEAIAWWVKNAWRRAK